MALNFTFCRIKINTENKVYTLTPTEAFRTTDEDGPQTIIIMYDITMYDISDNITTYARIPYYISDGNTNKLRANMLYPFMCINNGPDSSCPYVADGLNKKGGLLKYQVCKNINLEMINTWILSRCRQEWTQTLQHKGMNEQLILCELNKMDQKIIDQSRGNTVHLLSVLQRLRNFLDYLIAINTGPIITMRGDMRRYRPILNHVNSQNKLDMNFIEDTAIPLRYSDIYRKNLLIALNDQIRLMIHFELIETENIQYNQDNIVPITYKDFNDTINICHDKDANSVNVANYTKISANLGNDIITKINTILLEPVIEQKKNHFFSNLLRMLSNSNECLTTADNKLNEIIHGWKGVCYQPPQPLIGLVRRGDQIEREQDDEQRNKGRKLRNKYYSLYIKYKTKYLNLKNNLI
jgi:hypothetical protein